MGDWQIIHGDCLEVLKTLPSGSVDAVVTDPPYGIGKADWDSEVPIEWFAEAMRVLSTSGAAYVFGDSLTLSRFQTFWEDRGVAWKARAAWVYESGPRHASAWTTKHEDCLVYTRPDHKQRTPKEPSIHKDKRWGDERYIGDVWQVPRVLGNYTERTPHPTQKPEQLMRIPVLASTPEGGTVLDPFMGSGTTGVACINTGRKFIGIEIDAGYCEIARKRIEEAERKKSEMLVSGC